jgi:hypothetical protein
MSEIESILKISEQAATLPGQALTIALLLILGWIVRHQHKQREKADLERRASDDVKFKEVISHHEKFVEEVRTERSAMSAERRETNNSLVTLQKESTQAMLSMATAVDAMREWLKEHWHEAPPRRRPTRK